ncbi:MAG: hypothetical protein CMO66_05845 [Verrucomicrobiales bacterium]|nr:hypothetical protein [Verrucomicrobiales bacterium]
MNRPHLFVLVAAVSLACLPGCGPAEPKNDASKASGKDDIPKATETAGEQESPLAWAEWLEVGDDGRARLEDQNATYTGRVMDYYKQDGAEGLIENSFKDGLREGQSRWWHWNGKPAGTMTYRKGFAQGAETWWFPNGQKMRVLHHVDGELNGPASGWYDDGQPEFSATWKEGQPEGKFTEWHANGKTMTLRHYVDGERDGLETHWYRTGQKAWEMTWRAGKKEGMRTEWYEGGKTTSETPYKDDARHGVARGWYQNGTKSFEITWEKGAEVRHLEWNKDGTQVDLTEDGWNPDGTPRKTN